LRSSMAHHDGMTPLPVKAWLAFLVDCLLATSLATGFQNRDRRLSDGEENLSAYK
jgi:hypothetical protein